MASEVRRLLDPMRAVTKNFLGHVSSNPIHLCSPPWASPVVQVIKHLPAVRETRVQSLGWKDPLEKEMATHSSTLAWKIPWTEEPGRLQCMGLQRIRHD